MSRGHVIVVPLRGEDWRPPLNGSKGAWRCSALSLPSARFLRLRRTDGRTVADDAYAVRGATITWMGGTEPAPGIEVELLLRRRVFSGAAVLLAFAIGGVGGAFAFEHRAEVFARMDQVVASLPMTIAAVTSSAPAAP